MSPKRLRDNKVVPLTVKGQKFCPPKETVSSLIFILGTMMCSRPLLGGTVHSYVLISRPCRSRLKDGSQSVGLAGTSFTCVQRSRDCLVSELLVAPAWAALGHDPNLLRRRELRAAKSEYSAYMRCA